MVEMLVALAIFAVVIGVVFAFLVNTRRSYTSISDQVEYQQSTRAVLSLISREVRTAGCNSTDRATGTLLFERFRKADITELEFAMDLDADHGTAFENPAEEVTYEYRPGSRELVRIEDTYGEQVILRNVDALEFEYFDANSNPLPATPLSQDDRRLVRYVSVHIEGETDSGNPMELDTVILVRNN